LFASPSVHKDGNAYTPLGTEQIAILNDRRMLQLVALVDTLSTGYMSDRNKQEYIKWLEDPNTRLGEGEGRHVALVILGSSYYNRHTGERGNMTDDQRRLKLWEWNLRQKVPKSEKEFNQVWDWIVKTFRRERDARWEAENEAARDKSNEYAEYGPEVNAELQGNIFYRINEKPPKFIIAYNQTKKYDNVDLHINRCAMSNFVFCIPMSCSFLSRNPLLIKNKSDDLKSCKFILSAPLLFLIILSIKRMSSLNIFSISS
jgi:hypothetical protein